MDGYTVETIEKIGQIMSSKKSGSKLKQEIFNKLAIDGYWVVALHDTEKYPDIEERIMHDYYLGFEDFSTEDEIHDFLSNRPYLKTHPQLKQKVIEIFLKHLEDEVDKE